jgi:predicted MFS family arabinose efflux permease
MLVVRLGFLFSLIVIALAFMPTYWSYSMWLPIGGVTALAMLISANSYVQVNSDPAVRGRVMGIYLLIFLGGTPFGSLFIGYMTELVGVRETIFICGVIPLIAASLLWVLFKDRLEKPDDLRVSTVLGK